MSLSRRQWLSRVAPACAALLAGAAAPPPARSRLGIVLYSYSIRARAEKDRSFADPLHFVAFCHERGADGVQLPLGVRDARYLGALRARLDRLGMYLEGSVRPPRGKSDLDR